ncbi:MAG: YigZ family protein [Planctomycetes bacterium]|nr:YigZ family protein [Planctomycetota bacterium]
MHEGHPDIWIGAGDGPEIELKVKASRFLGQVFAARDEAEALDRLAGVRRRYHDARHHCWAYALPPLDRPRERFDDDGEPAQTAGPSILQAIQASGLKALIVVVTRWFGGIKLGSGGLIRAYGETAREALAATPRRENWIESRISIDSGYEELGAVEAYLAQQAARLRGVERDFADRARFRVTVARSLASSLVAGLIEATAARVGTSVEEIG